MRRLRHVRHPVLVRFLDNLALSAAWEDDVAEFVADPRPPLLAFPGLTSGAMRLSNECWILVFRIVSRHLRQLLASSLL